MENLGVVELKQEELQQIEGGKWDWSNFVFGVVAGFMAGMILVMAGNNGTLN